jgi:hypothetical protein
VQYAGVIDVRLGKAALQPVVSITDPRVHPIIAEAYGLTGELPAAEAVARLLQTETPADIIAALKEFVSTLTEQELRGGLRQFWTLAGARAVILARRNRREQFALEAAEQAKAAAAAKEKELQAIKARAKIPSHLRLRS